MDADRYRQIEDLFHAALGHAPEARGAFLDEAAMFPAGKFKDQIDALSGAFTYLSKRQGVRMGKLRGVY